MTTLGMKGPITKDKGLETPEQIFKLVGLWGWKINQFVLPLADQWDRETFWKEQNLQSLPSMSSAISSSFTLGASTGDVLMHISLI